jgi:hypothetical protein
LLGWKQVGSGDVRCEAFGDNALNELGDKGQVGDWAVGTGEIWIERRFSHDFDDALLSRAEISVTVAGAKRLRPDVDLSLMTGGSAVPVDSRIFSNLSLKKAAKSSTDSLVDPFCCGGFSKEFNAFHKARGLFMQADTVSDQNAVNVIW